MQVSDGPDLPYRGTTPQARAAYTQSWATGAAKGHQRHNEHAHAGAVEDETFLTNTNLDSDPGPQRRTRQHRSTAQLEKRYGIADPAKWDEFSRSLMQQQRLSSFIAKDDHEREPVQQFEVPSRTSSQNRALNRFARALEKYADVAGAAGRAAIMTPTTSESKVSYHTVQPLMPYREEFQAAGLAVTSAEQRERSPRKAAVDLRHAGRSARASVSGLPTVRVDGQNEVARSGSSISSTGSFVRSTPPNGHITHPYVPLPTPQLKNNRKSGTQEKRKFFPWFRKKSPWTKAGGAHHPEAQKTPQYIEHGPVQTKMTLPPLPDRREYQDAQYRTGQEIQAEQSVPRAPRRPLPKRAITPKKEALVALTPSGIEQRDRGPHFESRTVQPPGNVQPKLLRSVMTPSKEASVVLTPSGIEQRDRGPHFEPRAERPPGNVRPKLLRTPKKNAFVALSPSGIEQRDRGPHFEPQTVRSPGYFDPRWSVPDGPQGKREMTQARPPRPHPATIETIQEEKEATPSRGQQAANHQAIRKRQGKAVAAKGTRQDSAPVSPESRDSSIPSLPYAAKHAVSTASSLERALDAVSRDLDEREQQVDKQTHVRTHHPALAETTNQHTKSSRQGESGYRTSQHRLSRQPHRNEKFIYVDRLMPPVESLPLNSKPLPPSPIRQPPSAPHTPQADEELHEDTKSDQSRTEEILQDLDVFFDNEDVDIKDRDVIKGLHVAVHAAADDSYDAYIRHKTGLRIRRFLADLKAVDEVKIEAAADQAARQRRTEYRRLQRIKDRKVKR
ncbi:Uu.00g040510.m01.CDS01 [Anthostomella pinea]|uniref:Uu.00g040510.m01.CDS01 n=1 Tax=Anthostomella pinea TaxID=933095 RepID=A0AAI8YE28_9PEZI|nr:Uu.00g040510.m01.CDS01 [Anthostomella pinea]